MPGAGAGHGQRHRPGRLRMGMGAIVVSQIAGILQQPKTHEWETPIELFRQLDQEFGFVLDAAATDDNHLCPFYLTEKEDGLLANWWSFDTVFCNPPYGTQIGRWVEKGWREA